MEPERSVPSLEELDIGQYPEPHAPSPYTHILLFKIRFIINLPFTPRSLE